MKLQGKESLYDTNWDSSRFHNEKDLAFMAVSVMQRYSQALLYAC